MRPFAWVAGPVAAHLLTAVVLSLVSRWMRPGTYFGVRVPPDYRSTPQARRDLLVFRLAVWTATTLVVALSLFLGPYAYLPGFLIQLGAATLAWCEGRRHSRSHAIAPPSPERVRVPGGAAVVAGPFLVLAGVAAWLLAHWNSIPLRYPIHWDFDGHANGWSDRTFYGVFGPLLIGPVILISVVGLLAAVMRHARPSRRSQATLLALVIPMWIAAIMTGLVGLTPLILRNGQFPIPLAALVAIPLVGVAACIWIVARSGSDSGDTPPGHTPDECWKWGQFYYNPNDASVMVEKRFGIGYTLNFARWQSWLLMGCVLALPAVILVLAARQ